MIKLCNVKLSRDLSFIYSIMCDYHESSMFVRNINVSSFEWFETWFKNELQHFYSRFYMVRENDKNIGFVFAYDHNSLDRNAKMSVYISPKYQNLGIGAIATITFMDKLFTELNLNKIYSYVYEYNCNSLKCNQEAGFIQEGRLIKDKYYKDKLWDLFIYAMTQDVFYEKYSTILQQLGTQC